ncbi:hypothetical protein STENM36S_08258 [Streptomyces tendae]
MRRSKNSPEPSARGNFTPPPRTAAPAPAPAAEPTAEPAPSGGRFTPRNWRVTTRLNAILLIPVLVGLVMGGFQVKSSIDTWQDAEDAESTARLVRASLGYANALYNERDLTAAPLLQGKGEKDATVAKARQATDEAADTFDEAAQGMPGKPGLERRLKVFREQEPKLQTLRAAAYTSKLKGVDDIRELDPVGRSLMREERRAALEAQSQPELPGPADQGDGRNTEAAGFQDQFTGQQPGYDPARDGYQEQHHGGYDQQQAYADQQQAYQEPQQASYDEQYYAPNGGLPGNEGYSSNGGYPDPSYAQPGPNGQQPAGPGAQENYSPFEQRRHQDDWPQQDGFQNGYPDQYPTGAPQAHSAEAADVTEADRVGFDRPGPAPSAAHELTDAGLPRRGSTASGAGDAGHVGQETPAAAPGTGGEDTWRSANDDRWQQASALRKPKAGGVTSSGLPRRVPKANLVEGAAETTPQGGPQVSRAPEDVRGRLSNLRRGVERGRNAGSETNGQDTRNEHRGPDSTYNQER